MTSWYSSWLPGLPSLNFALPSSLQGRFISFVLKKSLGHFLKPGQLDIHQIDSQIGSGYVQVHDLELDDTAINALLSGLPVELHDGSISSVKAHIPWPNPLTSTLGFSLDSLHLTFHVLSNPTHPNLTASVADSVASIAESFIHEELTPREEATLWESVHPALASSFQQEDQNVPGGLDPFLSAPEDEVAHSDMDPAGVSIFASLIERLLARFEFDATNIKITLIHPGNISFTVHISEICYKTEQSSTPAQGETRTISISGMTVTTSNLRSSSQTPAPSSPLTSSPMSQSPVNSRHSRHISRSASSDSSSSLDEETQFSMSQSLAFLPPRPISPESSVASSMYQSAVSTAPTFTSDRTHRNRSRSRSTTPPATRGRNVDDSDSPHGVDVEPTSKGSIEAPDELLLSFGSSPILVRLTTPPTTEFSAEEPPLVQDRTNIREGLQISVTVGVVACAIHAWQLCGILCLANEWTSRHVPTVHTTTSDNSAMTPGGLQLKANLKVRGLVCIVLYSALNLEQEHISSEDTLLAEFFRAPLLPPQLFHSYIRLYLESLSATLSSTAYEASFALSLNDASLFSFYGKSSHGDQESFLLPLLISDHHLPMQYALDHIHPEQIGKNEEHPQLPTFDVMDWTDKRHRRNGLKLSLWRSKYNSKYGYSGESRVNFRRENISASPTEHPTLEDAATTMPFPPSICIDAKSSSTRRERGKPTSEVVIRIVPLHIFLDLADALRKDGILSFLDEVLDSRSDANTRTARPDSGDEQSIGSDEDEDEDRANNAFGENVPHFAREREIERRRLEKLVLEDLDLDLDYQVKNPVGQHKVIKSHKIQTSKREKLAVLIHFAMVRIQIRCPPPLGYGPRSGTFVFDFHDIKVAAGSSQVKPSTRFATLDSSTGPLLDSGTGNSLLNAEFRRIVISNSIVGELVATGILSLGSLSAPTDVDEHSYNAPHNALDGGVPLRLQPRIILARQGPTSTASSYLKSVLVLNIIVPSIHIVVSKKGLDGLQYWVDDVAQLAERTFSKDTDTEKADSRDTSLIGSRFFAKSRSGSASGLSTRKDDNPTETVVKAALSEVFIRILLPRQNDVLPVVRSFDISASDADILLELKPEGKDETVITVGVMDLTIMNAASGTMQTLLALTAPRSLSSTLQSLAKIRFTSLVVPGTTAKESKVKIELWGFTCNVYPDVGWISDLGLFVKSPPGAFESVIPSERTRIYLKISEGSVRVLAPVYPGAVIFHVGDLDFSTDVVGGSPDSSFHLSAPALALLAIDNLSDAAIDSVNRTLSGGILFWKRMGYALLAEVADADMVLKKSNLVDIPDTRVTINGITLRLHLCADSLTAVTAFASDFGTAFEPPESERVPPPKREPAMVSEHFPSPLGVMSSLDDLAFKQMPAVGPAPDMISDDLPTNLDYLDESFGAAAGLRELNEEDLDEFDAEESETGRVTPTLGTTVTGIVSKVGGETIKLFRPTGLQVVEDHFEHLPPDAANGTPDIGETTLRIRAHDADITLFLYDGYDWAATRRTIEDEVKDMRRRLAKIRQLVANGQTQDPIIEEETSTLLFNSVYIGLDQDIDALEPGALIAAIDEELKDDMETASQSSWQSLKPSTTTKPRVRSARIHGKRLTRAKGPSIEFRLFGLSGEVDQYKPDEPMVSRTFATVRDLEILDHIKTSTWKKFLTDLRSDSRGNVRETDSNMVRIELRSIHPVPGHPSEEARLRAKILPLRLYVDQDALDFLKKFFSFKDPHATPPSNGTSDDGAIYFQLAEIFPVDLKLDYKPRRVDYRALREGKTIELMNFFHFDGAEMTLRHITLAGITGWPRLFDMLNDLWTPDVKATQLVDVISGVAPIRSVVNVGSGVADLVLLPIAQYKKDGRIVRGIQKGTTAFVKSTAIEAIKLGARLATGTQVILEQAEDVLGGQFKHPVTAETLQMPMAGDEFGQQTFDSSDDEDLYSKYAQQPADIKEGMQSAYQSLQRNFNSAAQTILAVPMEVYERSGNEGPVRSVIRAVPIAVLKPMIGASEAVSKTLLGLHNTLDPNVRHDNEAKYKHR